MVSLKELNEKVLHAAAQLAVRALMRICHWRLRIRWQGRQDNHVHHADELRAIPKAMLQDVGDK